MTNLERKHPTRLNDAQYARCWKFTKDFASKTGSIRNKQLREISGIGYDQAIGFFNRAVSEERLERRGAASTTHYVLKAK